MHTLHWTRSGYPLLFTTNYRRAEGKSLHWPTMFCSIGGPPAAFRFLVMLR